jgi:hypothetical protein
MAKRWNSVQKKFPKTPYEEFKIWSEGVWWQYIRHKQKGVKKKEKRAEKTQNLKTVIENLPLTPAQASIQQNLPSLLIHKPYFPEGEPFTEVSPLQRQPPTPPQPPPTSREMTPYLDLTPTKQIQLLSVHTSKSSETEVTECTILSSRQNVSQKRSPEIDDLRSSKRPRFMIMRFIGESIREGVVDPEEVIVMARQIQQESQGLGDNDDGYKFAPILHRNSGSLRVVAGDSADLGVPSLGRPRRTGTHGHVQLNIKTE